MKKEVLLIFKTHLDIGYTDFASRVVDKYINEYIPRAIKVARELDGTDTPFIWTLGSWMVDEALKQDRDGSVERAVRDGLIAWHALPFTSHTEIMSKELFEYGLSIYEELDRRFGKKTVGAKMTDVPGHTVAMVPMLADRGVKFLHIGVNAATPLPKVPKLFRWRRGEKEITVMYDDGYGHECDFGDFAVVFAHTNDNLGPQSSDEIVAIYEKVALKYPNSTIKASTLDDVAKRIASVKDLPVITSEIGDTWIHGSATDPKKIGMYRELLRYVKKNGIHTDLKDSLLLVPEHTCGLAGQTNFPNMSAWLEPDMNSETVLKERTRIEKSWKEQRQYVYDSASKLGVGVDYKLEAPDLNGYERVDLPLDIEVSWQLFDRDDITRYIHKYMTVNAENIVWSGWDFTKPGLPDYKGGIYTAALTAAYKKEDKTVFILEFDSAIKNKYSLPTFYLMSDRDSFELDMIGKGACRLPQAFWLKIGALEGKCMVEKLGSLIDPSDCLGSPLIMAVDTYVENDKVRVYPIDSCLVAPFGRRLYDYEIPATSAPDLYFNLYNNIWNTNFPLWYSDDTRYRFRIVNK